MYTKEQYAQLFKQLLPPGRLFNFDANSNLHNLTIAIGQVFQDFSARCDDFLHEIFPTMTTELLEEWETEYGLPDSCSQPNDTIETRRKLLVAKYNALGGQTPAYYIALAAFLGFTITITEFNTFRTNINKTNDVLYGQDWMWKWQVNCPGQNGVAFKTNLSQTNEKLIYYDNQRLICFLNKYKPAHTEVLFNFI